MEIRDFYQSGKPVFSCEFFLPKTEEDTPAFFKMLGEIKELNPSFVTLTYGAAGSARERTVEMAGRIREAGLVTMMHLTGIAHNRAEIEFIVSEIKRLKLNGIMALRGDPPKDQTLPPLNSRDYKYGADLVRHLRNLISLSIGVGGYPEKHPEAKNAQEDLGHLKAKVDAGADFVATQLFFDNARYFEFVQNARSLGIKVPIVPGIMPITNFSQIKRFTAMCGASIPAELSSRLEAAQDNAEGVAAIGIEHAIKQCRELLSKGAPGIHFYTLNKSQATQTILKALKA